MRRDEALQPLSRDHHTMLVHARRLRGLDSRFDGETARRRFLSYAPVLELHFEEEDRLLAPAIQDPALRRRLADEHADLRRRIAALPGASPEEQVALGEALRLHVRFEEDLLFPSLQSALEPGSLRRLGAQGAAFRTERRPGSITGGEACFL